MNPNSRPASIGSLSTVTLLTLTLLTACQGRFDRDDKGHQAQAKKGPAQMSVEDGQTVLTLDSPTQRRLGLGLATLAETLTHAQVTLPAVVLPVQDLATFRNGYLVARAQLQKSKVEADVARKEYARLKILFDQNQNISEKSLQSADGTLQTNEADVRAGEQQLSLQESVVRQEWGSVVAKWAVEDAPELQHIFDQRELLVQMTVPSDATFDAPKTISLEIGGATRTEASLVSTFPRIDPRIQGRSFLYVVLAHLGLAPGINLLAHLSIGSQRKGLIVPTSAVVWSEGKAWVYRQTAPDRFTRRAVATDTPVETGFFVTEGFSQGDRVVTQGAQVLLSEEMFLNGQGGGDSDEN
jgi:membrane fusion protein, multidrug efflux system